MMLHQLFRGDEGVCKLLEVGGSQGVSIRIAKGVYYRVGAFKGQPVEYSERVFVGSGLFAVTNRHIYLSGGKSFRIQHDKIVTIEPFTNGVGMCLSIE